MKLLIFKSLLKIQHEIQVLAFLKANSQTQCQILSTHPPALKVLSPCSNFSLLGGLCQQIDCWLTIVSQALCLLLTDLTSLSWCDWFIHIIKPDYYSLGQPDIWSSRSVGGSQPAPPTVQFMWESEMSRLSGVNTHKYNLSTVPAVLSFKVQCFKSIDLLSPERKQIHKTHDLFTPRSSWVWAMPL